MNTIKVKVNAGRNRGQVGTVRSESKDGSVYVDFNRKILIDEGFGSMSNYEDGYWVKKEFVEYV